MAWALLPHDTPVGDLVGRSVVARGTVEGSSEVVLAARVTRLGDDVAVRWSTLSARTDPLLAAAQRALGQEPAHDPAKEAEVHRLPAGPRSGPPCWRRPACTSGAWRSAERGRHSPSRPSTKPSAVKGARS